MRIPFAITLAILTTWTAAAQTSHVPYPVSKSSAETFAALRDAWAHNLHVKNIDASVAEYAPDGDFIDPGGSRISGTQGIHHLFDTVTATYDSDLTFTSKRIAQSGSLAFDSGTYDETLIVRATQKSQHATGSYLTIYQRGPKSQWLIVQQIWTGTVN
jgi:ketosteroid isomerase-like protein